MIKTLKMNPFTRQGLLGRWHFQWKGKWIRMHGPITRKLDTIDSGRYDRDTVYVLRMGIESTRQLWQFAFYNGVWYEDTSYLQKTDFEVLVKAKAQKSREQVEKAERYLSQETETSQTASRERIPDSVQQFVWQRDGGQCVKCGSNEKLEFDHIIPVSKGGSNTTRNIQLLCESCNRSKGGRIGG